MKQKFKKKYLAWFAILSLTAAALLWVGRVGYSYLNALIFSERQTQLQEVVQQYFHSIDLVTEDCWRTALEMKERFKSHHFSELADVQAFLRANWLCSRLKSRGAAQSPSEMTGDTLMTRAGTARSAMLSL